MDATAELIDDLTAMGATMPPERAREMRDAGARLTLAQYMDTLTLEATPHSDTLGVLAALVSEEEWLTVPEPLRTKLRTPFVAHPFVGGGN
jgi:hypothetical protein